MRSTICIAEDRASCEPAIRLIVLSLHAQSPDTVVHLFFPPAGPGLVAWLSQYPNVTLDTGCITDGCGWNVKPKAMMYLLDAGFDEVIWIDSDILITGNLNRIFSGMDPSVLMVTEHTLAEERDDRNARRARLWGLPVGRTFPTAFSSGVVRATREHYRLLQRWWELLQSDAYQDAQKRGWYDRPVHMLGDQDVLTALVTSSEFSCIPLQVLRRGRHIIQFDGVWGYSVPERLMNIFGIGPFFIHAGATKPWLATWKFTGLRDYIRMLYLDICPYTIAALRYRSDLDSSAAWMSSHYRLGSLLRFCGAWQAPLVGLPVALFGHVARFFRWLRNLTQPRPATADLEVPVANR